MPTAGAARGLGLARLLDDLLALLTRRPLHVLLIAGPWLAVDGAMNLWLPLDPEFEDPSRWGLQLLVSFFSMALVAMPATALAAAHLRGGPLGPFEPWGRSLGAIPRWLWTTVLTVLLLVPLVFLFLVPALIWSIYWGFASNVVQARGLAGFGALRASHQLVRGRWWRVLGALLLLMLPGLLAEQLAEYVPEDSWLLIPIQFLRLLVYAVSIVGAALLYLRLEDLAAAAPAPAPSPSWTAEPPVGLAGSSMAASGATAGVATAVAAAAVGSAPVLGGTPQRAGEEPFHHFERSGWEAAARAYHSEFGRLAAQIDGPLLEAAGVREGARVLDVGCGPGYVAAAAAARGARVIGLDFSEGMLVLARYTHPDLDFREGDAEALPFEDASFDAVTLAFVLGHLGHPERALAEAWRVLRPGGRIAVSWWDAPERAVGFGIVLGAIRAHGTTEVPLPAGPPFERFSDPAALRAALEEAGFAAPEVSTHALTWTLDSGRELFDAFYSGSVRTAGLLRSQSPEALVEIRHVVEEAAWRFAEGGRLRLPMPALVASAVKA
jgi:ubiquinone/menaquinone biosynthesis C-methylase UbiE